MTHYVFTPCTGPIEGKDEQTENILYHKEARAIYCYDGMWYWMKTETAVDYDDWPHIEVLKEVEGVVMSREQVVEFPDPSTPILGAEEILDQYPSQGECPTYYSRSNVIQAMKTHSAQYRKRVENLEKENKELKERYFSAEEINGIQESAYQAGYNAAGQDNHLTL